MKYLLYNSLTNNHNIEDILEKISSDLNEDILKQDVIKINYIEYFNKLEPSDEVILVGGDGTINYLINSIGDYKIKNKILLYAAGTGNDFRHDVQKEENEQYILLNPYLENLPIVEVNGLKRKFINGIGYGIDGYCCEVGDKLRETTTKPINYTSIAIKGLLFHFKRVNATVNVDGNVETFKHVWLAPTMKGRYYGGGMMVAPNQDRNDPNGEVSVVVFMGKSKLHTLIVFPSIFKGEHVKHEKMTKVFKGKNIEITFDKPTALQVDGETIKNVLSYKVTA